MLATNTPRTADLERDTDGSLLEDDGLETVCVISLFTDALADADEVDPGDDRRGWWFDAYDPDEPGEPTGSKLWLILERGIVNATTLRDVETEAVRALSWMESVNAASKIEADCVRLSDESASLTVSIYSPTDPASPYTFNWELHFAIQ